MFEVSKTMMDCFSGLIRELYVRQKVSIFIAEYPKRSACIGELQVKNFIMLALQKGRKYNMMADREINGLLTMMHYLGCDFDEDPMFPWARFKCFPDKNYTEDAPESFVHLERVYQQFVSFTRHEQGEDFLYLMNAYKRMLTLDFKTFLSMRTTEDILKVMRWIYPQRYEHIPESALREPIMRAAQYKAMEYDLDPYVGKAIFAIIIFICGISVVSDPIYLTLTSNLETGVIGGMQKEQFFINRLKAIITNTLREMEYTEEH